jgi:hypothetical protein
MRSKTETVWIIHTDVNLTRQSKLSLCRCEIRRAITLRVHFRTLTCYPGTPIVIPSGARNLTQGDSITPQTEHFTSVVGEVLCFAQDDSAFLP